MTEIFHARGHNGAGFGSRGDAIVATMARRYRIDADTELGQQIIDAAACPTCQAELGMPCIHDSGSWEAAIAAVHDARVDLFDDGLLRAIEEMADVERRATRERDQLIVRAVEAGLSTRQIGAAAGLTHTAVQYIVRRTESPTELQG